MQTIIMYIENHWVIWLLGGINIALSWSYRKLTQYVSTEKKHMDAIMGGTRVLLRSQLLTQYNHYYKDLHYCPVYALDNIEELYVYYTQLGGNGTIHQLVERIRTLPTTKELS